MWKFSVSSTSTENHHLYNHCNFNEGFVDCNSTCGSTVCVINIVQSADWHTFYGYSVCTM